MDQELLEWYKKGYNDERRGTTTVESEKAINNVAYDLGAERALILSFGFFGEPNEPSDEDIIKTIKNRFKERKTRS